MAERLLLQMGPTLERLAPLAWHRDVNSHNMLVSGGVDGASLALSDSGSRASFWLCDLGLAVDSSTWISGDDPSQDLCCGVDGGGGAWRVTDIGGDCRYWPASSWMVHCYGAEYLEGQEDFCRQYQTRLDIHGLAVTAVEVVCSIALAARRAGAPAGEEHAACWAALLDAWQRYREAVTHWWEAIYSVFSVGGDFRPVHAWLVEEGVAEQVIELTSDIRQALLFCANAEELSGAEAQAQGCVLRILAELMDEASRLELGEACARIDEAHWSQAGADAVKAAVDKGLQALSGLKPVPDVPDSSWRFQALPGTASPLPPRRPNEALKAEEVAELRAAQAQLRQEIERLRVAKLGMEDAREKHAHGSCVAEP